MARRKQSNPRFDNALIKSALDELIPHLEKAMFKFNATYGKAGMHNVLTDELFPQLVEEIKEHKKASRREFVKNAFDLTDAEVDLIVAEEITNDTSSA